MEDFDLEELCYCDPRTSEPVEDNDDVIDDDDDDDDDDGYWY